MIATSIVVGMAEMHVAKGAGTFTCLGLGSCIGFCALDPISSVGGCVHIMLPEAFADKGVNEPGKFANTGVPQLLARMESLGASRRSMVVAIAGGAQVFRFGAGDGEGRLNVGSRNIAAVQAQIQQLGLKCLGQDVGGNLGRTVNFIIESGQVKVRTVSSAERLLCSLRG